MSDNEGCRDQQDWDQRKKKVTNTVAQKELEGLNKLDIELRLSP